MKIQYVQWLIHSIVYPPTVYPQAKLKKTDKISDTQKVSSLGFQMALTLANRTIPYVLKIFGFVIPIFQCY